MDSLEPRSAAADAATDPLTERDVLERLHAERPRASFGMAGLIVVIVLVVGFALVIAALMYLLPGARGR